MVNATSPVIMLELNELCPPIVDRMMAAGDLPNFKQLHNRSDVHVTFTDDESLEPWVQWVTLHTGQGQDVHNAQELDEGHLIKTQRLWDKLAEQGHTSLIFGSMNGHTERPDKVFLMPDPWSAGVRATDPDYQGLQNFVSHQVTEHTNPNAKPGLGDTAKVVAFLLSHGLSAKTIATAMGQITSEKTGSKDRHWRRAIILDLLMWDVFESAYKRQKPSFATYFANSTAFLQHRYWRHMEPDAYQVKPSETDMAAYGDAIEESYRHMDRIVGRAMQLVGHNGRIVFATALSQEANTRYEHIGGKFVYRPHDFPALFKWIDAPAPISFEPVMTHQAWATYASEEQAITAEAALDALQSNGKTVMSWRRHGPRLMFWSGLISKVEDGFELTHAKTGKRIAFEDLFMSIGQVNNSQHNRHGCLWLPAGEEGARVNEGTMPLQDATAKILSLLAPKSSASIAA